MPLSPREQRILDRIENELGEQDPALAATLADPPPGFSFWQRSPVSPPHAGLLVLALLTLIVLHPLALTFGPAGLGVLTAALIVPWVLSVARAQTGSRITFRRRRGQHSAEHGAELTT